MSWIVDTYIIDIQVIDIQVVDIQVDNGLIDNLSRPQALRLSVAGHDANLRAGRAAAWSEPRRR